jgi:hypothetical protein
VSTQAEAGAYALLTDGATVEIRAARPGDFAAVRRGRRRSCQAALR